MVVCDKEVTYASKKGRLTMEWVETKSKDISLLKGMRYPKAYREEEKKQYFYLCFIEDRQTQTVWLKCGITCNPERRMNEHRIHYGKIKVLWFSPVLSKYTAGKVEDNFKDFSRNHLGWEYKRNDRFILPNDVKVVEVQVRKTYIIPVYR